MFLRIFLNGGRRGRRNEKIGLIHFIEMSTPKSLILFKIQLSNLTLNISFRLLRLDISGSDIKYAPGDIALLQPHNLEENVEVFFSLFPDLGTHFFRLTSLGMWR